MSQLAIRAGLETLLNTITPALPTAWQNANFQPPTVSSPYQVVSILFARPNDVEAGAMYQEIGYMQVALKYPLGAGTNAASARAKLVREAFKKGTTVVNSGVTTVVDKTPEISVGSPEVDRWSLLIKIPFHADINP